MFCLSEPRDYRRAIYGSFFDESLIARKADSPALGKRVRGRPITHAAPRRNRDRATVELQVR